MKDAILVIKMQIRAKGPRYEGAGCSILMISRRCRHITGVRREGARALAGTRGFFHLLQLVYDRKPCGSHVAVPCGRMIQPHHAAKILAAMR